MSIITQCPRGDMLGIYLSNEDLIDFAKSINRKHIDEVIPLPKMSLQEQKKVLKNCKHKREYEAQYWESDYGSHGWCCPNCGTVTQWG